jgi:hypothetical protein
MEGDHEGDVIVLNQSAVTSYRGYQARRKRTAMTKHGMLFSTMLGGIGLVTFGLEGALGCSTYWIGHGSLICGGVFVLLAPVGYLAGVAIFWLLRTLTRAFARGIRP